ncbi:peptidase [Striga asiatica]|uniref:Peptidase n=1 Tax=Striga asiatica TaxID=4170 RepID=A0A5A7PU17_STRAF|nr:peptidase [Striga asiatica]
MEVCISSVKEPSSPAVVRVQKLRAWARTAEGGQAVVRRRRELKRVDRELEKGNYKAALSLVKQLKAHPAGLLRGFGAAAAAKDLRHVSALNELKLAGETELSSLQLVVDAILHSITSSVDFQLQEEEAEVSIQDFGKAKDVGSYDSIHEDHMMCMQHEAGHFLVGYMMGVLPRRYKVPCVEDLLHDPFARGKVEFVGFEFLRDVRADTMSNKNLLKGRPKKEVRSHPLSNQSLFGIVALCYNITIFEHPKSRFKQTLRKFCIVILGGLAAEHLLFGYSELLHSDVQKLFTVLKWLGLSEKEADYETRQAAEVAVLILSSQSEAQSRLAEAMALGKSVGFCINTIETALNLKLLTTLD